MFLQKHRLFLDFFACKTKERKYKIYIFALLFYNN